ncbi:MAG: ATP-dependent nuclease [Promethearchaeota archaeon]
MKMQKVRITNYRTIKDDEFYLYSYMVFVGKNNAGKSNLMKALDVFFGRKPEKEDFRLEGTTRQKSSTITVTFSELSPEELKLYAGKTRYPGTENEQLTLKQTLTLDSKIEVQYEYASDQIQLTTTAAKSRYGFLFNPDLTSKAKFEKDPDTPDAFRENMKEYINQKAAKGETKRLSKGDLHHLKQQYMASHPEIHDLPTKLVFQDQKIPKAKLEKYLGTYFFIPAVQDIDEETTYKAKGKTNINLLMNYILDQMRDKAKEEEQNARIQQIMRDIYQLENNTSELNRLAADLNQTLGQFDGSKVRFDTELPSINKLVRDSLKIYMDDGVETYVADKGHGLQRYFMVSLFKMWGEIILKRQLAEHSHPKEGVQEKRIRAECTSVFFAIEEPELFLHPQYQLLMRDYLLKIAFTDNHQILLNTHSPNFIDFNDYKAVVKVQKTKVGMHLQTRTLQPVFEQDGKLILKDIVHTHGRQREKFHKINALNLCYYMNPHRSQLFFADTVVLVEGETEKIMLAKWADYFFPEEVVKRATTTYVDCDGKFNMQLYQEMLNGFQIPYVVIIDDDVGSGDPTMGSQNYHIKKMADEGHGHFIILDGDFEQEFAITGHEIGRSGKKKNKPYQAFQKYFAMDQQPKVGELEKLRSHPKLNRIFLSIYQKRLN